MKSTEAYDVLLNFAWWWCRSAICSLFSPLYSSFIAELQKWKSTTVYGFIDAVARIRFSQLYSCWLCTARRTHWLYDMVPYEFWFASRSPSQHCFLLASIIKAFFQRCPILSSLCDTKSLPAQCSAPSLQLQPMLMKAPKAILLSKLETLDDTMDAPCRHRDQREIQNVYLEFRASHIMHDDRASWQFALSWTCSRHRHRKNGVRDDRRVIYTPNICLDAEDVPKLVQQESSIWVPVCERVEY